MSQPEVPDRRPLFYAAIGILILGIATVLFWPRPIERGPNALVLTPQDAVTNPRSAEAPVETALQATEESIDAATPPDDVFPVEDAKLDANTVVEADPEPETSTDVVATTPQPAPGKTPPPPASTSDVRPAAAGSYLLNVGSFTARQNAQSMADDLEAKGFPARVVQARSAKGTVYRVQIGYFEGFSLAEAYGREVKQRAGVDFWVGRR